MGARTSDKTGGTRARDFPLFPFRANRLFPVCLGLLILCVRRPREREQKGAVLRSLHIVGHALIQGEQVPGREIHYLLRQAEPDMAPK